MRFFLLAALDFTEWRKNKYVKTFENEYIYSDLQVCMGENTRGHQRAAMKGRISISDPVHEANVNYPSMQKKYKDHSPDSGKKELHIIGHSGIDAQAATPDFFSSRGGRVEMPSNDNQAYNPIQVEFADGSSQKTYHSSGNASYIFPGQVLRAGEYIGRIGGMPNLGKHLHQEYRDSDGRLLNTRGIVSQFMPESTIEGKRWECAGECTDWIKGE